MKIVKNRKDLKLYKFSNKEAKMFVESTKVDFVYSTKGAWKSRQNSIKKQESINRRAYFKRRRILKQRYLGGDGTVRIKKTA